MHMCVLVHVCTHVFGGRASLGAGLLELMNLPFLQNERPHVAKKLHYVVESAFLTPFSFALS